MREKGKKRAYLELPILVDEPKRTFLERVWPVSDEERKAIKVSQDAPEESKFSLLSEEETTRVPLFKPSKIKDIDAYVETRKIVAKTSTLPSFMLPVEENYPIRYKTTTVTRDVNGTLHIFRILQNARYYQAQRPLILDIYTRLLARISNNNNKSK